MKKIILLLCVALSFKMQGFTQGQNAAPSQHLPTKFDSKAMLMTGKVKIIESAGAEYFSILNYKKAYGGLQQGPSWKQLIASMWDANTATGDTAKVEYIALTTQQFRFGGEGDGAKTENKTYIWDLNTWYTLVVRSWRVGVKVHVATFIHNATTYQWFHTATISRTDLAADFLGMGGDSFMENWASTNSAYDGRFKRKAFFKDYWIIDTAGTWKKPYKTEFYANSNDSVRNGLYNWAFNAGYDATEDAYLMEHGGNVTPSAAFGTRGRYLLLPAQTNQGTAPVLTVGAVTSATAINSNGSTKVNWVVDLTKSPQLSSKVEIINLQGIVVSTIEEILPQKRQALNTTALANGNYTARITITDIFNQVAVPVTAPFNVNNPSPVVSITSPINNTTFTAPETVTINADATVSSGNISKVEFFQGVTKLGEDLTAPYSYSWINAASGTYAIKAIATTDANNSTVSTVVNITVGAAVCTNNLEPNASLVAAITITTSSTLISQIAAATDADWFKFTPTASGKITITLSTLPFDYDISLNDANGTELIRSENSGTANESFFYNVSAGVTYYFKIQGWQGVFTASNCYTLSVSGIVAAQGSNQPVSIVNAEKVNGWFSVKATPNPSDGDFKISVNSYSSERVVIRIMDIKGSVLKVINSNVGTPIQFGKDMSAGTYLVEVKQGTKKKVVKVIKL